MSSRPRPLKTSKYCDDNGRSETRSENFVYKVILRWSKLNWWGKNGQDLPRPRRFWVEVVTLYSVQRRACAGSRDFIMNNTPKKWIPCFFVLVWIKQGWRMSLIIFTFPHLVKPTPAPNAYKICKGQTSKGVYSGCSASLKSRASPYVYSGFPNLTRITT